jgi:hypothetical protein
LIELDEELKEMAVMEAGLLAQKAWRRKELLVEA